MLEQQRFEYLQAMGIQLWMPRQPVDNAPDSLWLAGDELKSANESATDVSTPVLGGHAVDLLADSDTSKKQTSLKTQVSADSASVESVVASPADSAQPKTLDVHRTEKETVFNSSTQSHHQMAGHDSVHSEEAVSDLTVPEFELFFAHWPCGILWVSSEPFTQKDQDFQTSVSHFLLNSAVPRANYSHFKWPYIQASHEDQSTQVALRALTAQWDYISQQGARAWVSVDNVSLQWLSKVASKPLFSVDNKEDLFSMSGKKQLWQALLTLPSVAVA